MVRMMSIEARDKLIARYWREGYSARSIGEAVGLSERGVRHALERISANRPGRPMREK
jgi:DNA-binding CsgD family transcriptional regulator